MGNIIFASWILGIHRLVLLIIVHQCVMVKKSLDHDLEISIGDIVSINLIFGQEVENVCQFSWTKWWRITLRWRHNGRDGVSNHQDPRLFTQQFIRTQIKVNIKAPRHWPLCGEFTGDRWIPRTKGQRRGKCFHLMTSSWNYELMFAVLAMHIHGELLLQCVFHKISFPRNKPFSKWIYSMVLHL